MNYGWRGKGKTNSLVLAMLQNRINYYIDISIILEHKLKKYKLNISSRLCDIAITIINARHLRNLETKSQEVNINKTIFKTVIIFII